MTLAALRLRNQFIQGSRLDDPAEIVRALCAVQAQDYYASLWAIGLRSRNLVDTDVEKAIAGRRIVRTWPMRGTLHFVAAEDARWMIDLLGPRILARNAARLRREFSIDRRVITRATKVVEAALRGGVLTRDGVYEQLDAAKIPTDRQRGLHLTWWLANEGVICCGPRSGKQPTFVLFDEWVPRTPAMARDEALIQLARRYFAHHGPATAADFSWWSGITMTDATSSIESIQAQLTRRTIGDATYWSQKSATARNKGSCYLLPVYDELTVGYADRSAVLGPTHANNPAAGHGIFRAPILIDGMIVGSWTRQLRRDGVEIEAIPFGKFSRAQKDSIEEAAERYGKFVRATPKVRYRQTVRSAAGARM
ncbi:hypothetical protein HNQ60_005030 [Povalibacter uvarum]|uniref:Winged helix DNA-binding domain-containing protein n=1 Tax=Povalibacter uvarum TaxID=732238 RepID=A0A841HV59_9GAMM|nr:winged helix DNA-binding domain-containing protein [Povalibacter uvarum]MBB6096139.1 hypothetical protein [Povalibacter uvarum]